jgi:hypothetical protein
MGIENPGKAGPSSFDFSTGRDNVAHLHNSSLEEVVENYYPHGDRVSGNLIAPLT